MTGWLKQPEFISSQLWRIEVSDQGLTASAVGESSLPDWQSLSSEPGQGRARVSALLSPLKWTLIYNIRAPLCDFLITSIFQVLPFQGLGLQRMNYGGTNTRNYVDQYQEHNCYFDFTNVERFRNSFGIIQSGSHVPNKHSVHYKDDLMYLRESWLGKNRVRIFIKILEDKLRIKM